MAAAYLLAFGGLLSTVRASVPAESVCSSSSTLFCSGFEEGNFSVWDDYDGNPSPGNTLVADPGPYKLSGNTAARLLVPAGTGGRDFVKVLPGQDDKVYVRWFQKWEAGYDFSAPNHGSGLHAGSRDLLGRSDYRPTGADWFSTWLEPYNGRLNLYTYYRGMYQDCSNPNGSCWGDRFPCFLDDGSGYCTKAADRPKIMPPLLQTDRWYCLEVMVDSGTPTSTQTGANGALDFWIDGTEYGPFNNLWLRTTANLKPTIAWLSTYFHSDHAAVGVRFDNVVVSRTRVGCGSTTAVVPNPPTNVRVN
jgi:hypothetical protein